MPANFQSHLAVTSSLAHHPRKAGNEQASENIFISILILTNENENNHC
jgi:hypothetical protein